MRAGETIDDRFVVDRRAGAGGMGEIYRALDRATGKPVAIKLLRAHAHGEQARFVREAELLASLSHPAIVRYVGHGVYENALYLAMEWLEGENLHERLVRGSLGIEESVALVRRAAEAVGFAHARGVVHRDLKPNNLFLENGRVEGVRILDFGIARIAGTPHATRTGVVIGTPAYMAPEQARGDRGADARVDVFALGCILFECLAGRPAFIGEHAMALLAKVLLEQPPRISTLRPDVPASLDALLARALAKDAAERPTDANAFAAELGALGPMRENSERPPPQRVPRLTESEQRLLCVILVGPPAHDVTADGATLIAESVRGGEPTVAAMRMPMTATLLSRDPPATLDVALRAKPETQERLRVMLALSGARFDTLADGSLVVGLTGSGTATDLAAHAARCALAIRTLLPSRAIAIATGRGVLTGRSAIGEALERAAALMRATTTSVRLEPNADVSTLVPIDDVTAGLLDPRFEVVGIESADGTSGLALRAEHEPASAARTVLGRVTPCVGRERELDALEGVFRQCAADATTGAVLVTAPPGVGKSRLRQELVERIERASPDTEIWIAHGDPMMQSVPHSLLVSALRRTAGIVEGEAAAVRRQKLRARLGRRLKGAERDRVSELIGELLGIPEAEDRSGVLRAARQDPALYGEHIARAFRDLVAAECAAAPLLFLIDDLHWGDRASVRLLEITMRELREAPFIVQAFARPEVKTLFPGLWSERLVQEIRLPELSRRASEQLVRAVLDEVSTGEVARLVAHAGGNAFYLEELMRAAAEGKHGSLPPTVLAMVHARLEGFDAEARRALRAASIFGETFWRAGVEALVGEEAAVRVAGWLGWLVEREVISKRAQSRLAGQVEYGFRHALICEAAQAMLTDADRRLGNRLAASWLEQAGEAEPAVLAGHYDRGGLPERAATLYVRAAEQALSGGDLAEVVPWTERGSACLAAHSASTTGDRGAAKHDVELGVLRVIEGEARYWRGELRATIDLCAEARAMIPRDHPRWADALRWQVESQGVEALDRLLPIADQLAADLDPATINGPEARACVTLGISFVQSGIARRGIPLIELAMASAHRFGDDPLVLAWIHRGAAALARFRGDFGAHLTHTRAILAMFERVGYVRGCCAAQNQLGAAMLAVGDLDGGEAVLRETLSSAERLRLPGFIADAQRHLARAAALRGELDQARILIEAARAALRGDDPALTALIALESGKLYLTAGDFDEARRELTRVVDRAAADTTLRSRAEVILAALELRSGHPVEALALARAGVDAAARGGGGLQEDATLGRLTLVEALWANGQEVAARRALQALRDDLLADAQRLPPESRAGYLEHLPVHARALALTLSSEL